MKLFAYKNFLVEVQADPNFHTSRVDIYDYGEQVPETIEVVLDYPIAGKIRFIENKVQWIKVFDPYKRQGLSKVLYDSYFLYGNRRCILSRDYGRNNDSNRAWKSLERHGDVTAFEEHGCPTLKYSPRSSTDFRPVNVLLYDKAITTY